MSKRILIPVLALVIVAAFVLLWRQSPEEITTSRVKASPVGSIEPESLAVMVDDLWHGRPTASSDLTHQMDNSSSLVYIAARRRGRRLAHSWRTEGTTREALSNALANVKQEILAEHAASRVDVLETVFAYNFRNMSYSRRGWASNIHRGVRGMELGYRDVLERYSPTYMLATNRKPTRLMDLFQRRHGLSRGHMRSEVTYRIFDADQWLIKPGRTGGSQPEAIRMERGNQYVPLEQVTAANAGQMAALARDWLSNNLHEDGRMTYKYWPSPRQESTANNMIRQWMATVALIRAARHWQDDDLMQRAAGNIDYNLEHFYHEEDGYGLIEWQGKVKLGAVALAALALAEHPQRERWQAEEKAMQRTIDHLWQENGAFRTFYKPAGRNDIQNFYPGEALLYWATLYEQGRNELLERIMASFRYYRDWHLRPANRNPAFIPWHTQAYYKVWRLTRDEELQAFIFEMNDWLIDQMQQWEGEVKYRDALGRFYNPRKRYGPPHVSSTGVYMEGLIDAFELARSISDETRQARYRTSLLRGMRSVMQLQFADEVDMYYVPVSERVRVRGGFRTTLYNNEIRCDNVQHNLMAIMKILDGFSDGDYAVR